MDTFTMLCVLLAGVLLLYILLNMGGKWVANLKADDYQQALDEKKNMILIDVRTPEEFKNGHLPTAINIPVKDLGSRIEEIDKDKTIFIYCQSGARSKQAGRILSKHGFTEIFNLRGGIMSWNGIISK